MKDCSRIESTYNHFDCVFYGTFIKIIYKNKSLLKFMRIILITINNLIPKTAAINKISLILKVVLGSRVPPNNLGTHFLVFT